jgi:Protein of unknown function (DUF2911)
MLEASLRQSTAVLCGLTFCAVALDAVAGQRSRISPHDETTAVVDGARVTIRYGRPSMRGRTIFGALVPFGRVWCPGADEATTLENVKALRIGGVLVPAGSHTIWMLPTADRWVLIISDESSGFHTQYNPKADLGRVELRKRAIDPPVERLTFAITRNLSEAGGAITMTWATTEVFTSFTTVH